MFYTHAIDAIAFQIGPLAIRWYGLAYAVAFLLGYLWLRRLASTGRVAITLPQVETLLFAVILGVVIGGRVGYFLFYHLGELFQDPFEFFRVWNGGMSFHGGLIGVLLAVIYCSRKFKVPLLAISDLLVVPGAFGLAMGRIANFVNGELWGRPTSGEWGVIFPRADDLPRHPSQLYASFQNLVITVLLVSIFQFRFRNGTVSFLFLILYGIGRIINEQFWRAPLDGYLWGMTKGQFWSMPMLLLGVVGLAWIYKRKKA